MTVSGMAAAIRSATESETFDLAGQTPATITHTVNDAFGEPFTSLDEGEMIRITFVTGAGKLARQKYDEGAAKAVTAALRSLGFEEDRAASCVAECGGSFKMQHDTGKNLKTVVVFPNVAATVAGGGSGSAEGDSGASASASPLLPPGSPEQMIAMASNNVFERMVTSKCHAWHQKKGCLAALESIKNVLESLDAKLLAGTPLSDAEQELYDSVSISSLTEKEAIVKKEMHTQVETDGNLTTREKEMLLEQVTERLEQISQDIAESKGKPKRLEKLEAVLAKLKDRKSLLEKIEPKPPHKLRNEAEIAKLRVELRPLQKIEDGAKGRLLTLKETQTLARKDEILEQIEELENSSRGWFEDDEAFVARVEASRGAARVRDRQKNASKKSGPGYKPTPVSSWVTPGAAVKKKAPAKKSSKSSTGGGMFAAMMMDSDSD